MIDVSTIVGLCSLCFDCESSACAFNKNGECRFALVNEKAPVITEEDGYLDMVADISSP